MEKKVLIILTTPFDGYGISVVVKNYCLFLKEKINFEFLLCAGYTQNEYSYFLDNGFNVFFPKYSRNRMPLLYMKWLTRFIRDNNYEVVHAHGNSGTLFFDIYASKKAGVKNRIAHCHNSSCNHKIVHHLLKPLLKKNISIGVACSELAGKWLFDNNYVVLNNAIDTRKYKFSMSMRNSIRKELNIENSKVLLNVGRLHSQKNQLFLIEMMSIIVKKDSSYKLFIIGDGELKNDLIARIKELGLEKNVFLLGKKETVSDYYFASDLFLFPSIYEGLGLVAIEAEASGLGVIASNNVPREISISNNVFFLNLDVDLWIKEICFYFDNYSDNRELTSKQEIDNIKKKMYDISCNCEELLKLYEKHI